MRYPNRFNYSIDIDEAIDTFETYIPSMIIQPFIENSIEHGFEMSTKEGNINIHFSKQATELIIILTDNGRGLNADKKEKKYPSRATQIIKDRLLILNKHYKSNSDFEIKSGENGSGTVVKIRLPFLSNISH